MNKDVDFEAILNFLPERILIADADANVVFFNDRASTVEGIPRSDIKGKNILEIFPGLTRETSLFYKVIRQKTKISDYYQSYENASHREGYTMSSAFPIMVDGELAGVVEIYKDISDICSITNHIHQELIRLGGESGGSDWEFSNGAGYDLEHIIGNSLKIKDVKEQILRISHSEAPVMIYGKTGVGKELVAQAVHNNSRRRNGPFIAQNCAAIPKTLQEAIIFGVCEGAFTGAVGKKGLFEMADQGTLLLDEINSMDLALQAKLLRAIQEKKISRVGDIKEREINTRIIACLNEAPAELISMGRLREDLFFRLSAIEIYVPTLAERREDIAVLAEYFVSVFNQAMGKNVRRISEEVLEIFRAHPWDGNVRELRFVIEGIMNFVEGNEITLDDLPSHFLNTARKKEKASTLEQATDVESRSHAQIMKEYEERLIRYALRRSEGNLSKAARMLQLPKQTLHNKLKQMR